MYPTLSVLVTARDPKGCGGTTRDIPLNDDGMTLPLPAEMVDTDVVERELVHRAAVVDDCGG